MFYFLSIEVLSHDMMVIERPGLPFPLVLVRLIEQTTVSHRKKSTRREVSLNYIVKTFITPKPPSH
jgi:hypothetical protein